MNTKRLSALLAAASLLIGCDKSPNIASDSQQVQAEPFHGQVYRSFNGRSTLTLISQDECELNQGGTTLLCKYTKQPDALRVVVTAMGTNQVIYYRITDQGIQDNSGNVMLSPDRYAAAIEQARIAREAEAARQRASQLEQERQRQMEEQRIAERKRAAFAKRDAVVDDIRKFFAKGATFKGTYYSKWSYQHKNPNLPYQLKISGEMTVEDDTKSRDPFDQHLGIPAHFDWLGATETISPSSWGGEIKEYDGMIWVSVEVDDDKEPPAVKADMKFCIRDPSWPSEWVSREEGSTWDGTQFIGNERSSIALKKP